MEKKGISEGMIRKIKRIYKKTRSRVGVSSELGECFWTARGVKQECLLSPHLFKIFLSDLEDELGKGWWRRVTIDKVRIYCLSYADDIMVLAEGEKEMRELIKRLEKYLNQEIMFK